MSRNITDFFNTEYLNWANYDNFRSLPSFVDGLKPTARKTIYTFIEQNIHEQKKVSQLQAKVSEFTNYIHGDGAIAGVIIGLVQKYVGSNNLPLLKGDGHFGTRQNNAAAAPRYISASKTKYLETIFHPQDNPVLIEQIFEGEKIEPKYFVPVLPILLINGCQDAMSVAFASHILPRNIDDVVDRIYKILDGKEPERFYPYFNGFKGIVALNQEGQIETRGIFNKTGPKELTITELPIGVTLAKYREILDKLEEKKVIVSWRDESDTKLDTFKFKVKLAKVIPDEQIYSTLKLVKRDSENFTCIDENTRVRVFENELEILKEYVKIRLEYYQKRKDHIISMIEHELKVLKNKIKFLKLVIGGQIVVFKQKREKIEEQIVANDIEQIDGSYDYLLSMPIVSFTEEKLLELLKRNKTKEEELVTIKQKDTKTWWKEDIKELLKSC
jgi:DNA topoisomerase-2